MTMPHPHPQCTMIPFGCVIRQRVTQTGMIVDIFRDAVELGNVHNVFTLLCVNSRDTLAVAICKTQDDPSAQPSRVNCSVISHIDVTLYNQSTIPNQDEYQAWRLQRGANKPEKVDPPANDVDKRSVMVSDWFYFLLPYKVKPPGTGLDSDSDKDKKDR